MVSIFVAIMQQRFPTIDSVDVLQKVGIKMNVIEEILYNSSLSDGVKARITAEVLAEELAKGEAKGLEQGKLEGIALGKVEGEAKGKAEREEKARETLISVIVSLWPLKFAEPLPATIPVQLHAQSLDKLQEIILHWQDDEPTALLLRIVTP